MKKQNTKYRNNNGITLIALIITIVVLLILAVVSIGAIKNSKIITHAQDISDKHAIAQDEEQLQLALNEWQIQKNTQGNTETFKSVITSALGENAKSVIGEDDGPLTIKMSGTEINYTLTNDGKIEKIEDSENGIAYTKDLSIMYYFYSTMYNPEQPEIIARRGYYDDDNNDRISDFNSELGAYIHDSEFNILNSFFSEQMPTEGNIEATITHFDGREQQIILTTNNNKVWTYKDSETVIGDLVEGLEIWFCPNAVDVNLEKNEYYITSSNDYHFIYISGELVVPFYKLTMLGKTIEFPFNCQAMMGIGDEDNISVPMYSNIEDVSKITVNYSNNTSIEYTKDNIFDMNQYYDEYVYSSEEKPVLYNNGAMVINMPYTSFKTQITSVIIEENGLSTQYNVSDNTSVLHTKMGS